MSNELRVVAFDGDEILTFEHDNQPWVVMRRVVENLGMAWPRQSTKLEEQASKFNCSQMGTVGADGKRREMLCMPVEKLHLWLASINPNKIGDMLTRAKVERYQAESADALDAYWTVGIAIRPIAEPALPPPCRDVTVTDFGPSARSTIGGVVKSVTAQQHNAMA